LFYKNNIVFYQINIVLKKKLMRKKLCWVFHFESGLGQPVNILTAQPSFMTILVLGFSAFFLYILHLFLNNYCAACLEVLKKKLLAAWKKFLAAGMNLGGCYQGSDE